MASGVVLMLATVLFALTACASSDQPASSPSTTPPQTASSGLPTSSSANATDAAAASAADASLSAASTTTFASSDDPLAGTWSYGGLTVKGRGSNAVWSASPAPGTLTIDKTGQGYKLEGNGATTTSATLHNGKVTLDLSYDSLFIKVHFEGTLNGDTIKGTQFVIANASTHQASWTATRAK
jgi:uncharacterized membrane protein